MSTKPYLTSLALASLSSAIVSLAYIWLPLSIALADPPSYVCDYINSNPNPSSCELRVCDPAQRESTCKDCYFGAGAPLNQSCAATPEDSNWSPRACSSVLNHDNWQWAYPLTLDPLVAFGPVDFPPLYRNPLQSSSPLLSPEARQNAHSLSALPERPSHGKLVDLITGVPLVQETDFELPFGGAVFRSWVFLRLEWPVLDE
jgi:hypothetical protein